jgi:hypothetical protein
MQDSITASLSRFPKLQRLTLSGAFNNIEPFFAWSFNWEDYSDFDVVNFSEESYEDHKYTPESFDEAARDLGNGCRTLTVVTMGNLAGALPIRNGLSARIIREFEGGLVKEVEWIQPWGNIIGREDEW